MPFYTVQQGDTILALAVKHGLDTWEDIVNASENASIKDTLADPGILKPGISLFIPNKILKQQPSAIDAKHPFKVGVPSAWLRLALKNADGTALGSCAWEIDVGKTPTGTTAADGIIEVAVPVDTKSAKLKVTGPNQELHEWQLKVGWMDPLTEDSGVLSRLTNLSFGVKTDLAASVKAFQERVGLTVTGMPDDDFRTKLKSYYDPATDETTLDVEPEAAEGEEEEEEAPAAEDEESPMPKNTSLVANVQLCKAKGADGDKLRLRTWIAIELVGEDGKPIPSIAYNVLLPGGTIQKGTLDAKGSAVFLEVPPGICQVSFPELDKEAWVRQTAAETETATAAAA
jgi:hypothetical protein